MKPVTMPTIITLTTDWGADGLYSAALKGLVLRANPGVNFVDISHTIKHFDKLQAALVLRNTYHFFPAGTIHIIGVVGKEKDLQSERVVFEKDGYFFIGANNGMWGLMFDELPRLHNIIPTAKSLNFPELEGYADAIHSIINSKNTGEVGVAAQDLLVQYAPLPSVTGNVITGQVMYIDTYGNAITNISRDDFDRVHKGRRFRIYINSQRHFVDKINKAYSETGNLELMAMFGFTGMLEIAMVYANVNQMLNLQVSNPIRIVFDDFLSTPKEDFSPVLGKQLF